MENPNPGLNQLNLRIANDAHLSRANNAFVKSVTLLGNDGNSSIFLGRVRHIEEGIVEIGIKSFASGIKTNNTLFLEHAHHNSLSG
mmetsp:Transcript_11978/g.21485  ORF Transcript_11978/g.21485 Transcript_11978/m.21485 type:complete len:86 (+) Transcript_11978:564-821(+)